MTSEELRALAAALESMGCPAEKSAEMAKQLNRRAEQLAAAKGRSHQEALVHLLRLMRQGWAAQNPGTSAKPAGRIQ